MISSLVAVKQMKCASTIRLVDTAQNILRMFWHSVLDGIMSREWVSFLFFCYVLEPRPLLDLWHPIDLALPIWMKVMKTQDLTLSVQCAGKVKVPLCWRPTVKVQLKFWSLQLDIYVQLLVATKFCNREHTFLINLIIIL